MVPGEKQLYEEIRQPTLKTWMGKPQVMTMLTQTRGKKTIHPKQCAEMILPRQKLQEQWKKDTLKCRKTKMGGKREALKNQAGGKLEFAKQLERTYIMQLVEKNPEMPEELALNKDRRKQLAELMLEYPTRADDEENPTREQEKEKRYYTCQNCRRAFGTIRGKLNHREHNPKCKEGPQKEEFVSKCQECSRTF